MTFRKALEFRKKNLHLVGKTFGGMIVKGVFVYPREKHHWETFISLLFQSWTENFDAEKSFPKSNFGLKIYLYQEGMNSVVHMDLSRLPEEYKVKLPKDY